MGVLTTITSSSSFRPHSLGVRDSLGNLCVSCILRECPVVENGGASSPARSGGYSNYRKFCIHSPPADQREDSHHFSCICRTYSSTGSFTIIAGGTDNNGGEGAGKPL